VLRFVGLLICMCGVLGHPSYVVAETKVALVIGNSAYQNAGVLTNPANDAEGMAGVLTSLGFKVTKGTDLDKVAFDRAVSEFAASLPGATTGLLSQTSMKIRARLKYPSDRYRSVRPSRQMQHRWQ
jgi:hypothetical protein